MAHFYGITRGSRGKASRLGTKASGLETVAASWQGAVRVFLSEVDGQDWATVALVPWRGQGTSRVIYAGPVSGAEGGTV